MTTPSTELPEVQVEGGLTARPEAISDLFSREPDSWTEADMERLVTELRKRRKEFLEEEAKPKERKAKAKAVPREDLKGLSGADLLAKLSLKPKA